MSYYAICTFDLKGADRQDYVNAYTDLANLGLHHTIVSSQQQKVVLPTTMVGGEFDYSSASQLQVDLTTKIKAAFQGRGLSAEIFVVAAGDWAWGYSTI